MTGNDWTQFADDLREHTRLDVRFEPDANADGLHVLTIDGADFYFNADGSGYDGWGRGVTQGGA